MSSKKEKIDLFINGRLGEAPDKCKNYFAYCQFYGEPPLKFIWMIY
jgi:hypothetical protein